MFLVLWVQFNSFCLFLVPVHSPAGQESSNNNTKLFKDKLLYYIIWYTMPSKTCSFSLKYFERLSTVLKADEFIKGDKNCCSVRSLNFVDNRRIQIYKILLSCPCTWCWTLSLAGCAAGLSWADVWHVRLPYSIFGWMFQRKQGKERKWEQKRKKRLHQICTFNKNIKPVSLICKNTTEWRWITKLKTCETPTITADLVGLGFHIKHNGGKSDWAFHCFF